MSVTNLSNQHISASYQNLVQISSSNALYNGTGSLIPNLLVTASYALSSSYFAGNSISASYVKLAQSASYVLNAKSASFASTASLAPSYLPLTGGVVTGSIDISGSVSLNSVLTLTPRTTTPTPTAGMLIVSGSGANQHIYCYLNNSWKQLNN